MSDTSPIALRIQDRLSAFDEAMRVRAALVEMARPANKAALFDALARACITTVFVAFDGAGDSGQIESVFAYADEAFVDLPADLVTIREPRGDGTGLEERDCPVAEAIEAMAYAVLEETHRGWENHDGAFGTFTFDVADRAIQLEYNERRMDYDLFDHVF